jgi:hypothetical protein
MSPRRSPRDALAPAGVPTRGAARAPATRYAEEEP